MSVTLSRISHERPFDYRIKYEDEKTLFNSLTKPSKLNDELPIIKTSSKICIQGAGFAGIASAIKCIKGLKEEDFTIFERHDNYGGTWYANTYPGCASDIPALWYSLSDELNSNWSELQPPQPEMEEYILTVVEKYKLKNHARFNSFIRSSVFDEDTNKWIISGEDTKTGQRFVHTSDIILACRGGLVVPNQLQAKGLETFNGTYMHSAIWDHSVSFKGKDVVVIGNGCSANQVIPVLLDEYEPKSMVQIARSKMYVHPPFPKFVHAVYRLLSFSRFTLAFFRILVIAVSELRWPVFRGTGFLSSVVRWISTKVCTNYIKSAAPERYHEMLTPDFKIGCKRLIFDKKYFPSLHDPRMTLTDQEIDHIDGDYVILKNGKRIKTDIIVACTGYSLNKHFTSLNFKGRNGTDILNLWSKEGVSAYQTLMVKDMPNLFIIGGPNSATGHSSVVMAIELGLRYFELVIKKVAKGEAKTVEVKPAVYDEWLINIQKELKETVFGSEFGGCQSWYAQNGVNPTVYPHSQIVFWWRTSHPKWKDLEYK